MFYARIDEIEPGGRPVAYRRSSVHGRKNPKTLGLGPMPRLHRTG
jgi:hypothetical protein